MPTQLTAESVYRLSRLIQRLQDGLSGSQVVIEAGKMTPCNTALVLETMNSIYLLLNQHNLAPGEQQSLNAFIKKLNQGDTSKHLDYQDQQNLQRLIERVESTVWHEIVNNRNFKEIHPTEGIIDYTKLLARGVKFLFGNGIYYHFPKQIQDDLEEASKSLSFGAPTACVMIGLRAVEGELRHLYRGIANKTFGEPWGKLVAEIEKLLAETDAPNSELLDYLGYLRTVRNQVDHPDKSFTTRQAEQMLMHAVYTIEAVQTLYNTHAKSKK